MKVKIYKEEWYPIYCIAGKGITLNDYIVDLTKDEYERIRKAFKEFDEVQSLIIERIPWK